MYNLVPIIYLNQALFVNARETGKMDRVQQVKVAAVGDP